MDPHAERTILNHDIRIKWLEDRLKEVAQRMFMPKNSEGGGGESTRLHWTRVPSGGVPGCIGTFPSYSAESFTADVYRPAGASLVLAAEAATVYWRYMDGADAGKIVPCVPNADGSYEAVLDSCTSIAEDA